MNSILTAEQQRKLESVVGEGAITLMPEDSPGLEGMSLCEVRPSDAGQVKGLVDLARSEGLNLVPVSSGAPHLKGGSIPAEPAVMVDLSRMDRIVRVDRRNRVALVEPGVTFAALELEAGRQGLRVLSPLAPRPGKSVLASCLEREPFLVPKYHFDTTDPLLCTEVVFGSGDFFRTGSAAGPGSLEDQWALGNAQKNPMGPASSDLGKLLQGSQGTLGLVTWGTVKLEVKPSIHTFFFIQAGNPAWLSPFIYEACKRRLGDEMLVLDATALACLLGGSPDEIRAAAGRQAPYTLIYAMSGIADMLPERRVAYQEKDLGLIARSNGLAPLREIPGASGARVAEALRVYQEPGRTGRRASRGPAGTSSSSPPWTGSPASSPSWKKPASATLSPGTTWVYTSSPSSRGAPATWSSNYSTTRQIIKRRPARSGCRGKPPRPWRRRGPSSPGPTTPGPAWPTTAAPTPFTPCAS